MTGKKTPTVQKLPLCVKWLFTSGAYMLQLHMIMRELGLVLCMCPYWSEVSKGFTAAQTEILR